MKQGLQLTTKQRLGMTPRLQQAIKLLQLSASDLELEVKLAVESNPMLEALDDDLAISTVWQDSNLNLNSPNYETASTEMSLQEHLHWQLNLTPFSEQDHIIALNIIDSIAENGYLTTDLAEIKTSLQKNYPLEFAQLYMAELTAVLHRIQQFDPLGVASRNLQECLLLQLAALPATTPHLAIAEKLVIEHLDLLAKKNYPKIRSLMRVKDRDLQAAMHLVMELHPYPGEKISQQRIAYIIPDLSIDKEDGTWTIALTKNLTTKIRVNPSYAALIKHADNSRDNQFLREQLHEAKWFLNSLRTRNQTLSKVATCIMQQQVEFLEHGEEFMQPLILQDIAHLVGLNASTISRVTDKKYIHTPHGIYELKFFFSSHIANKHGEHCSSTAIKAIIKQVINKEQATQRLTDQEITDIMLQRGIKIVRRTVAKYRESLGIQCSNQR